jgi:hypothetical protein
MEFSLLCDMDIFIYAIDKDSNSFVCDSGKNIHSMLGSSKMIERFKTSDVRPY